MFFKSNINRIRKAVIGYLIEEGFKAEMENGLIVVDLDEWHYIIDFDLENEYSRCDLEIRIGGEEYEALELSQKTFIADKINTDEDHHSVVKAFSDEVVVNTYFYFSGKNMLLSLFHNYFVDLKETVDELAERLADEIEKNKRQRRPIGFMATVAFREQGGKVQPAAYEKNETK